MNVMFNISYGLYILTANEEKMNGCVINALSQVTSTPNRIMIAINKNNHTTAQILKTKKFNVSILNEKANFDLIKRFGFASGRDTNKFEDFAGYDVAENGIPYITQGTNSYICADVVEVRDLGTHYEFLAEVVKEVPLNELPSITYAYYQANIKPKVQATQKKVVYICSICGYVYEGDTLPEDFVCPLCLHDATYFERSEI